MPDPIPTYDQVEEFARLDTRREDRQGLPEFVYAASKTPEQVAAIMETMVQRHGYALASRATSDHMAAVQARLADAQYDPTGRLIVCGQMPRQATGLVRVVAAGTSDLPVAEEACGVLDFLGDRLARLYDVGVAGVHRLLAHVEELADCDVADRRGGHGRRAADPGRRAGGRAADRRADQRRLRGQLPGTSRPAGHAQFVRAGRDRGQHR